MEPETQNQVTVFLHNKHIERIKKCSRKLKITFINANFQINLPVYFNNIIQVTKTEHKRPSLFSPNF